MQQNHVTLDHAKNDAAYGAAVQIAADFSKTIAKRATGWHVDWPAEFNRLHIVTNRAPIFLCKA
jgi:hypothetical protein